MNRQSLIAPEQYNLTSEIEKHTSNPEKLALKWQNEDGDKKEITYLQLMKNVNKLGNLFREAGLKKGDTVLVIIPRLIEAYQVYTAALKIGAVVIPSSEMLKAKDLQYRISHGNVTAVVCHSSFTEEFKGIPEAETLKLFSVGGRVDGWSDLDGQMDSMREELEAADTSRDDMAFLAYTSGTTGNPKGVVHTHGWAYAHLHTAAENWLGITEGDVVWATAAPGWQKWIWSPFLSVLGTGSTGFVYNGRFEPEKYLSLMDENGINVLCCTPTEYRLMAKVDSLERYKLENLHSAVSAGEPLNQEVIETFGKHFNVTVRDGYGQTENTLLLGVTKGMAVKPGSMGKRLWPRGRFNPE